MQIKMSPQEAVVHGLQLAVELARTKNEEDDIKDLFIHSFEPGCTPFVMREDSSWLYRLLERIVYFVTYPFRNRQVLPYNLEENFEFLYALFQQIVHYHQGGVGIPLELRSRVKNLYGLDLRAPLTQLVTTVGKLFQAHAPHFNEGRRLELQGAIAKIQALFATRVHFPKSLLIDRLPKEQAELRAIAEAKAELEDIAKINDTALFLQGLNELDEKVGQLSGDQEAILALRRAIVRSRVEGTIVARLIKESYKIDSMEDLRDELRDVLDIYDDLSSEILYAIYLLTDKGVKEKSPAVTALEKDLKEKLYEEVKKRIVFFYKAFIEHHYDECRLEKLSDVINPRVTEHGSEENRVSSRDEPHLAEVVSLESLIKGKNPQLYRVLVVNNKKLAGEFRISYPHIQRVPVQE